MKVTIDEYTPEEAFNVRRLLSQAFLGRYISTDRPSTDVERIYFGEDLMGGAGYAVAFTVARDGKVWLDVDWGMSWAILPGTTVSTVVPATHDRY